MAQILTSEHVFICGMTGCGKTVLAEVYLAGYESVIKLDTKNEVDKRHADNESPWHGLTENKDFEVVRTFAELEQSTFGKIIYAPIWEENNMQYYDMVCEFVYKNGNTILWIDELMTVTDNALKYPKFLKAIMTAGRSRSATVWALTQRPSGIPAIIPANCTHIFVFSLPLPIDRKKMVEFTGAEKLYVKPEKYCFWYFRDGMFPEEITQAKLAL